MKTIAFFNNKGGVGKTTLTCNLAAHFALRFGARVLIIDCDPQCNSTQLLLSEAQVEELYWSDKVSSISTVRDVVAPIEVGGADINPDISPLLGSKNRFGADLLAGHPRLSIVEDKLSDAWTKFNGGDIGGLRITSWLALLADALDSKYDYAFVDLGPSLGSLNRTVLYGSDYFLTPMGADIFSIVGIRNIASWLSNWIEDYKLGVQQTNKKFPDRIEEFKLRTAVRIEKGFIGYTVQQYITKSIRGQRRPTAAFERILQNIPGEIDKNLGSYFVPGLGTDAVKLGDVPNLFSLIPLAQTVNAPLIALSSQDGLVGGQFGQASEYATIVERVANALAKNLKVGGVV